MDGRLVAAYSINLHGRVQVEVVHDIIRGPNGGRNCIVKFKDQRYSQLIEAEIVRQHAPRVCSPRVHNKLERT